MSALISVLKEERLVLISARIFFYGSHTNVELVGDISAEINSMWNEPEVIVQVNAQDFGVRFQIDCMSIPTEDVIQLAAINRDIRNNFVRIEEQNILERSMMGYGLGDNAGHWLVTDQLGQSTTAAHEFGHALGLPHPERVNYRNWGAPPPIMAPRGTIVDAAFQWDPTAATGAYGGTMKPIHRRVHTSEILAILSPFDLNSALHFQIGRLSNSLFDSVGNKLQLA